MATLTPTYGTGALTLPAPMITAIPERLFTEDMLGVANDRIGGMNGAFLFGQLSMALQHERCGNHLYKSVAARTNNPMLKSRYEEFGNETARHVELLEELITAMGGSPQYVSPAARAIEKSDAGLLESTFLASGSVDVMTSEAVMLTAVMIAESVDHSNWQYLTSVCQELPSGDLRDLMQRITQEVTEQEDKHLTWATDTRAKLSMLQTKSSAMAKIGMKAEEMLASVKSWFT
ncbi:MAG TPA: DUF892 family protein [Acidimicrobiales bacterium]